MKCVGFHHLDYHCYQQEKLLQVITIIGLFPFFFFFLSRQSTVDLQRSETHANKKIKDYLNCHHLWSMENL